MIEEVRKFRNHRPFSPYTIVLNDGRALRITDQFQVAFGGKAIVLFDQSRDAILQVYDQEISSVSAHGVVAEAPPAI